MIKIKRNDICHCGSKKKYKKCCLSKDEAEKLANYVDKSKWFEEGHELTEEAQDMHDFFTLEYPDFKIIDVSKVITGKGTYKTLLERHYFTNTVMLAIRNEINDKIFQDKGDHSTNWMVMFKGAHQVFNQHSFESMKKQLKTMINMRLKNEGYSY